MRAVSVRPDYIEYGSSARYELAVSAFSNGVAVTTVAGDFEPAASSAQIVLPTDYIDALGYAGNEDAVGSHRRPL